MSFIRFKLHFLQRSSSEKSVVVKGIDRMMEVGGIFFNLADRIVVDSFLWGFRPACPCSF